MSNGPTISISPGFKRFLGIAIYAVIPWAVLVAIFALTGSYKGDEHHPLANAVLVLGIPITLANGFAVLYGLVWVIRQLRGNRRVGWVIAFVVGGFITACFWWWTLIRPLPRPSPSPSP